MPLRGDWGIMASDILIQATALNRFYGDYHAVKDFNLTLHKGEVLGLLGPNGAGKSSTMQMLTGNISPSSGEIKINDIDLLNDPMKAKSLIGYLPEQPPIYRDMTAVEFLKYCAVLHNVSKEKVKGVIDIALDRCGLQSVSNKLIANLSKGFQQRVGIAQAILHQPDIVILDEPTVGLDPIQITQIRELIQELGRDHSVILSTHILPEVQAVCDRVQIINQGKTVFSDTLGELTEKQSSTSLIIGFDEAIEEESLAALVGIDEVIELESSDKQHRYQLHSSTSTKKSTIDAGAVFQLAVEKGWKLKELTPKVYSLEQIFMDLIHSDSATSQVNIEKEVA